MNELARSEQPIDEVDVIGKTFGIRAWAYIIDLVILFIVNYAVTFATGVFVGIVLTIMRREFQVADEQSMQSTYLIVGLFQTAIYFAVFEWLYGASVGKLVLGMRVVMENGDPCSLGGALIRGLF